MKKQLLLSIGLLLSLPSAVMAAPTVTAGDTGCPFKNPAYYNNPLTREMATHALQDLLNKKARLSIKQLPVDVINEQDIVQVIGKVAELCSTIDKKDLTVTTVAQQAGKTYLREKLVQAAAALVQKSGVNKYVPEFIKKNAQTQYLLNLAVKEAARVGTDFAINHAQARFNKKSESAS